MQVGINIWSKCSQNYLEIQVGEVVAGVQLLLSPFLSSLKCQLVKDQENHYSFFGVDNY